MFCFSSGWNLLIPVFCYTHERAVNPSALFFCECSSVIVRKRILRNIVFSCDQFFELGFFVSTGNVYGKVNNKLFLAFMNSHQTQFLFMAFWIAIGRQFSYSIPQPIAILSFLFGLDRLNLKWMNFRFLLFHDEDLEGVKLCQSQDASHTCAVWMMDGNAKPFEHSQEINESILRNTIVKKLMFAITDCRAPSPWCNNSVANCFRFYCQKIKHLHKSSYCSSSDNYKSWNGEKSKNSLLIFAQSISLLWQVEREKRIMIFCAKSEVTSWEWRRKEACHSSVYASEGLFIYVIYNSRVKAWKKWAEHMHALVSVSWTYLNDIKRFSFCLKCR